ncbi:molybdenum cofactor guanylyltransferase [Chloroflexota bacterium]
MEVTSIILAGGRNLRLGRNKALETIGGKRLIERVVERVKLVSQRTLIVTAQGQPEIPGLDEVGIVADLYPGKGPLGGIYTGLHFAQSSHGIVVACDMPFLNPRLFSYMIELSSGFDAVVPRLREGRVEPLHAVYSKSCLDDMKARLEHNQLEVNRFLSTIRVRYIDAAECRKFDPKLLTFFNINSQLDLDRAVALAMES